MFEKMTIGFCKYLIVKALIDSRYPSLPPIDEAPREVSSVVVVVALEVTGCSKPSLVAVLTSSSTSANVSGNAGGVVASWRSSQSESVSPSVPLGVGSSSRRSLVVSSDALPAGTSASRLEGQARAEGLPAMGFLPPP